jgi:hypothetical protein
MAGLWNDLAVFSAISDDLVNYFVHVLRIEQEVTYVCIVGVCPCPSGRQSSR